MSEDQHIFLGLGSNVGNRYENLKFGIDMLKAHPHIWVTEKSHVYQSPAMYNTNQDEFYNMVIEIDTNLIPLDLLNEIKTIEKKAGRKVEKKKYLPRVLDIDILAYGSEEIMDNNLTIPHPGIFERKFVLQPWSDIAEDFILVGMNESIKSLLHNTPDKSSITLTEFTMRKMA